MKKTAKRALSHTNTGQLIVRKIADKYEAAGQGSLLLLINEPDVIRERNYWQTRKSSCSLPPRENAKKVIRNGVLFDTEFSRREKYLRNTRNSHQFVLKSFYFSQ